MAHGFPRPAGPAATAGRGSAVSGEATNGRAGRVRKRDAAASHVTMRDVARAAGVSVSTVSRVVNGGAGVRGEKTRSVERAIRDLGYRPNWLARELSLGAAVSTVGVLVPQLADEFTGSVVTGVERELKRAGFHMVCSLGHGDPRDEAAALQVFRDRRVTGLILVTPALSDNELLNEYAAGTPLVLVNHRIEELAEACIHIDNEQAGYLAARHLLELGHRDIVHISGPLSRQDARARQEGFQRALEEAGLERDAARVVEADYNAREGEAAMRRLLRRGRFTALFAANDVIAAGAMVALREAGMSVPGDVSVVGFDDRSLAVLLEPPLTTIRYPMEDVGCRAARHLVQRVRGEAVDPLPLLPPTLIVRRSSGPPPRLQRERRS